MVGVIEHLQQLVLLITRVLEIQAAPAHGIAGIERRPAELDVQHAGKLKQTVPHHLRLHAAGVHAPVEMVARIGGERLGVSARRAAAELIGARGDNEAVQAAEAPAMGHEIRCKMVEQQLLHRRLGAQAKVVNRLHQRLAKVPKPNMIHCHARGERILRRRHPPRQRRTPTGAGGGVNGRILALVVRRRFKRLLGRAQRREATLALLHRRKFLGAVGNLCARGIHLFAVLGERLQLILAFRLQGISLSPCSPLLGGLERGSISARLLGSKHGFQCRQFSLGGGELCFANLQRGGGLHIRRRVFGISELHVSWQRFDLDVIKRHRRIETGQLQPPVRFTVGQRVGNLKLVIEPHVHQPIAHRKAQCVGLADHDGLRHEAVGRIRARSTARVGHMQLGAGRVGAGVHIVCVLAISRDIKAKGHRPINAAAGVRVAAGQFKITR